MGNRDKMGKEAYGMGELAIRRNRVTGSVQQREALRAGKSAPAEQARKTAGASGDVVSQALRERMSSIRLAEPRESRRTLQRGEAVLAEVQDCLDRMAEAAREAVEAGGSKSLQEKLKGLAEAVDRMLKSAGDLFLPEGPDLLDGSGALLRAIQENPKQAASLLPQWLIEGASQNDLTPGQLLELLGVDKDATSAELLEAIANAPLEKSAAASRLAALYLGAVLVKGSPYGPLDPEDALLGLKQLMDQLQGGVSADGLVASMTDGAFQSLLDVGSRFTAGTAPGLEDFLADLLLGQGEDFLLEKVLLGAILGEDGQVEGDPLTGLFQALAQSAEGELLEAAAPPAQGAPAAAGQASLQLEGLEVTGRNLEDVAWDSAGGLLRIGGKAEVLVRGTGPAGLSIVLTGSGRAVLQDVHALRLMAAEGSAVRVYTAGENALEETVLGKGASLTLGGVGFLKIGRFRSDGEGLVRLTGGGVAVTEDGRALGRVDVPVVLAGTASFAARASQVRSATGQSLEPFDFLWKAMLPGWSRLTAAEVDGRHGRMHLASSEYARLWLDKGERGSPFHTLFLQGKDPQGRTRTRYAYLHWNQSAGGFEETSMYPNPFTVTGGEPGRDWVYEEETQTLRILSSRVTGLSGGTGTSADQALFCGRLALAEGIGVMTLALDGVSCQVDGGCAFDLGARNKVTLLLKSGTENVFTSGGGFAGIALGEGTSLTLDAPGDPGGRTPLGTLTASGGSGGAGIGRNRRGGMDQTCGLLILAGTIQATCTGGGAGLGGGVQGAFGEISIQGGTVTARGGGGGAGIGGGLDGPVGDIQISGGKVTAGAACHAAAIGAGVRGACGDIRICGSARLVKVLGGNPGADIGGCLFGGCGEVRVSGAADLGGAKLWTREGLEKPEEAPALPRFRLSAGALGLDRLDLTTREQARSASAAIDAGQLLVARVRDAYGGLYGRLERSREPGPREASALRRQLLRDIEAAKSLLEDTAAPQASGDAVRAHGAQESDGVQQLLE